MQSTPLNFVPNAAKAPVTPDQAPGARWSREATGALFALPFNDLLSQARQVYHANFDANAVQLSTLLSIKTGSCPGDRSYRPQSTHHDTGVEAERLTPIDAVLGTASRAKQNGASRFCMGATWRNPKPHQLDAVAGMVCGMKAMGLEICVTLGMFKQEQATQLKEAGLGYYNHSLNTAPEFYGEVVTARTHQDRLDTLERVRDTGINACCDGIVGLGESVRERAGLIAELANMEPYPDSVPVGNLAKAEGTSLADNEKLNLFDLVRTIAVARITTPKAIVRLPAGHEAMGDALQALCFMAGANSISYDEKLPTTDNPETDVDRKLLARLGMRVEVQDHMHHEPHVRAQSSHCHIDITSVD